MNGVSCVYSASRTRSRPSANTNRLWLGIFTTLCTTARRADGVQVGGLRRVHARLALRHHNDGLVLAQRIDQLHRTLPPDRQGQHGVGKQHRVAHRQNRQRVVALLLAFPMVWSWLQAVAFVP